MLSDFVDRLRHLPLTAARAELARAETLLVKLRSELRDLARRLPWVHQARGSGQAKASECYSFKLSRLRFRTSR